MGGRSPPPMRPRGRASAVAAVVKNENRSEEHTSELQSQSNLVCRLLLEKKSHYRSLDDFVRRTWAPTDAIEGLATGVAFTACFGLSRREALWAAADLREPRPDQLPRPVT